MYNSSRLSRLTHPRATLIAMVLLVVVFGLFGAFASAAHPELSLTTPATFEAAATVLSTWICCH